MLLAHPSLRPLRRRLYAIIASCQKLIESVCNPYRPELHYMRGRGPKWRAKQRAF
ncbi:hypothetical protein [Bradyrhizobium cenepequi]|uniref:hypothetical protein n=1 Tax=Bradyrhizobium cenepequi TaxID=2821403 RepID=UPI001CE24630|nr:hypothetical protein [Bradyrhizobium cenepequi]MCA6107289.1 hypothetical protein [Bradyrhizobium cenepequi]